MFAGGIGRLDVAQLYLCSVVRDGDGGRISAKEAGVLCSASEHPPPPKCARQCGRLSQEAGPSRSRSTGDRGDLSTPVQACLEAGVSFLHGG